MATTSVGVGTSVNLAFNARSSYSPMAGIGVNVGVNIPATAAN